MSNPLVNWRALVFINWMVSYVAIYAAGRFFLPAFYRGTTFFFFHAPEDLAGIAALAVIATINGMLVAFSIKAVLFNQKHFGRMMFVVLSVMGSITSSIVIAYFTINLVSR